MADYSPWSTNPSQNSNQERLGFGKSVRLFHSANWAMDWLKIYSKTQDMYFQTLPQWQVNNFFWELHFLRAALRFGESCMHRLLTDRALDDGKVSGYCFLIPSEFICGWILDDEGIHVQWDLCQIMKVTGLKKQPKNSRFYSLVLFTKPQKTWNIKHSSHCFVCQHFFTKGWDQTWKFIFLICNKKKNQIFTCCCNTSWTKISI